MKKILALLLVVGFLGVAVVSVTGCGGEPTKPAGGGTPASTAKK